MSKEEDRELQARLGLLDYFGSHLRSWTTNVLALVVVIFTIFQFAKYFCSIELMHIGMFWPVLIEFVYQALYAVYRVLWHGRIAYWIVKSDPLSDINRKPTIVRQVHDQAVKKVKEEFGWLAKFEGIKGWAIPTIIIPLIVVILSWLHIFAECPVELLR